MRRATVSATLAWLALLITRSTVTIVPGRALITTTPADCTIHPADHRGAIGARYRAVPESDRLGARRLMVRRKLYLLPQGAQLMAGALTRWDPFAGIAELRSRLDRVFDEPGGHPHGA